MVKRGRVGGQKNESRLKVLDDSSAVVGFLVFLIIVLFVFDALSDQKVSIKETKTTGTKQPQGELSKELADNFVSKLTVDSKEQDGVAFIVKDTVDPKLLDNFASMDYEQVKSHLGMSADFMIHFEDEEGRIVPIGGKLCFGSGDAKINGVACG